MGATRPRPFHRAPPALLFLLGQVFLRLLNPRGELAIDAVFVCFQDDSCLLRPVEPQLKLLLRRRDVTRAELRSLM